MANLRQAYHTYANRQVLSVFALGISSGLPWVMIGSALSLWLKESGVSRADIGFAGLIFSIYAINFLWSPLVDAYRLPLPAKIGDRRSWILCCQLGIALCCGLMSQFPPSHAMAALLGLGFLLAFLSATQDVAIDAYRIDTFDSTNETRRLSAASAAATAGWWTGYAGLGGLPLWLSDAHWSWPNLYWLMAVMMLILVAITLMLTDPPRHLPAKDPVENRYLRISMLLRPNQKLRLCTLLISPWLLIAWGFWGSPGLPLQEAKIPVLITAEIFLIGLLTRELFRLLRLPMGSLEDVKTAGKSRLDHLISWLMTTLIAPLEEFFVRKGFKFALVLLAFILIFKLGEAFLGRMSIIFYKDIGYSNSDIATYSKLITWWATVVFAIPCGLLNARLGIFKGLFISGCAMAASNLMFAWIAVVGPDVKLLAAAVLVDGFTSAWATVAFVSFISALCHRSFSATQYALFASIGNFGRTTIAANSGFLVDSLNGNWALFFLITTIMVVPGLVLLSFLRKQLTYEQAGQTQEEQKQAGL